MPIDEDEFFLPPCVIRARRRRKDHWAHSWTPPPVPLQDGPGPARLQLPPALPNSLGSLFLDAAEAPVFSDVPRPLGEDLDLGSEDEPQEYDVLDAEESADKEKIWHEVNKDLLQYWDLGRKQRAKKKTDGAAHRKKLADKGERRAVTREERLAMERQSREARVQQRQQKEKAAQQQAARRAEVCSDNDSACDAEIARPLRAGVELARPLPAPPKSPLVSATTARQRRKRQAPWSPTAAHSPAWEEPGTPSRPRRGATLDDLFKM